MFSTQTHNIDNEYLIGKVAKFKGGSGRIIAVEVSEIGDILVTIDPIDGNNIIVKEITSCSLVQDHNTIPSLHS